MVLKIGFDIDGTITTPGNLVPLINKHFNKQIKLSDIYTYEIHDVLKITSDEAFKFFSLYHDDIVLRPKMMKGAVKLINQLIDEGNEVYLITARKGKAKIDTLKWMKNEGLKVNPDNLHFLGSHDKQELIKNLKLDIYVDDRLETLINISNIYGCKLYVIDAPYNRFKYNKAKENSNSIIRVKNYKELKNEIYSKGKV